MTTPTKPSTYLDKLLRAQRAIKAAQYRTDARLAVREVCEGLHELLTALIDREQGGEAPPAATQAEQKPVP